MTMDHRNRIYLRLRAYNSAPSLNEAWDVSWFHWHILCQCYLVEYAPRLFPGSSCHLQEFLSLEGRNPFYPVKKAEPGIFRVPEVFSIPAPPVSPLPPLLGKMPNFFRKSNLKAPLIGFSISDVHCHNFLLGFGCLSHFNSETEKLIKRSMKT